MTPACTRNEISRSVRPCISLPCSGLCSSRCTAVPLARRPCKVSARRSVWVCVVWLCTKILRGLAAELLNATSFSPSLQVTAKPSLQRDRLERRPRARTTANKTEPVSGADHRCHEHALSPSPSSTCIRCPGGSRILQDLSIKIPMMGD